MLGLNVGTLNRDQNPWLEPAACRIQGLITLTPHTNTSGGFHCIPGFHRIMPEYAAAYASAQTPHDLVNLPNQADKAFVQRIPMRAGGSLFPPFLSSRLLIAS